jgi:hypothetical protein
VRVALVACARNGKDPCYRRLTLRYVSCMYVLVGSDPFLHMYVNVNVYICIRVQVMAGGHASSSLSEAARVDVCAVQLCVRMYVYIVVRE